nr:hypothetical protein [Tanacetum cinerariifolium]
MKPKADIGIFIGYSESFKGFQIYNRRTRKIMETIHVKFNELTAMVSEHNCLEPRTNRFQDNDSSAEDTSISSKEDLDNLFGLMYEEYFEKRSSEVSINFDAQTTLQDTSSSSSIIVEDNEAPPLVSSSKEQIFNEAGEFIQEEDFASLDEKALLSSYHTLLFEEDESSSTAEDPSNMQVTTLVQTSTHVCTKAHPLDQVIDDSSRSVMIKSRIIADSKVCVKTSFLNDPLKEEVYVSQPDDFVDPDFPDHVYILKKALYGLKHASRACQSQYVIELLKKHGMDECDSMSTPMATTRLDVDLQGTPIDQTKYHSMIEGLMYLNANRPDIAFATFVCARYQARPMVNYLKEVKWIFRYLRQSYNMGLWYLKDSGFELIAYSDADHAGCHNDCKIICMRTQLLDYGYKFNKIQMYCDSKSSIAISCNPVQHSRTKHINIQYYFIKEHVEKGTVELYFVRTEYQLAGLFMKSLPKKGFEYIIHHIEFIMAQKQQRDVPQDQLCPPNKRFDYLMDANKKFDLEDGSKYKFKFFLGTKELTMTIADFRRIFQLPQATDNNNDGFVAAPTFSQMDPFFLKDLDFRRIFQLPQATDNNNDGFVAAPTFSQMDPFFLKDLVTTKDAPLYADKEKLKTGRFRRYKSFIQQMGRNYGYMFTHLKKHLLPRKEFHQLANHLHSIMEEFLPSMVGLQYQLYQMMKNAKKLQRDYFSIWWSLKIKFDKSAPSNTPCRTAAIHPRDHDDHHDDARSEGENSHEHKFITELIVRRANGKIGSMTKQDYKYLNKNDIEDLYMLCINVKVDNYRETGLLGLLIIFIRSTVIWERVHDFQPGMESYQQKVNLNASTITFLGIEEYELFIVTSKSVIGIIYNNNKKEKKVVIYKEIHKFCDVTLKRVLERLKKYNKDVKYGYADPSPNGADVKYL